MIGTIDIASLNNPDNMLFVDLKITNLRSIQCESTSDFMVDFYYEASAV